MSLKIFESVADFIQFRQSSLTNKSVGLVPTMGALHAGHGSLIKKSAEQNDQTVLSIYVNPTQFNNPEDLKKYPRTWDTDLQLAEKFGASVVLAPKYENIYPDHYRYRLIETEFSKILCGAHRPGHFDGVLTIVMKLLQISQAQRAYFGEKDFQQFKLIQDMAKTFFVNCEIIGCTTQRESDGLAMSSRNLRLSEAGRKKAPALYQALKDSKNILEAKKGLENQDIQIEYLEEHLGRRFIAAYIDDVRLIDNVKI